MLTNLPSRSGAGSRGRVAREHGACLTFLAGAVAWMIPFSRAWGSSQGKRAGLHVLYLQSGPLQIGMVMGRRKGAKDVQETIMAHQDAWGCSEEPVLYTHHMTLPYTLLVLGSWEGTHSSSSKSPFNFEIGIFLNCFIAQAFFNYFFFTESSRPEGNCVSTQMCTSNQPRGAHPL